MKGFFQKGEKNDERHQTSRQRRNPQRLYVYHRHIRHAQSRLIHARRFHRRRISELLSLSVGDVYQNKKPVTDLLYGKSIVKGGEVSRSVPVNADGRRSIDELVNWHRRHYGNPIASKRPLFPSRHKSGTVPMHRQTAHAILKTAFIEAGLNGHIATHSLRKSFRPAVV